MPMIFILKAMTGIYGFQNQRENKLQLGIQPLRSMKTCFITESAPVKSHLPDRRNLMFQTVPFPL